jgi:hypothetical protein
MMTMCQSSVQDDDGHRWHGDMSIEKGGIRIERFVPPSKIFV